MRSQTDVQEAPSTATACPTVSDMVWIPGGDFMMGSDRHYPEEAPAHLVHVDSVMMDRYPVTNARFREFVADTDYVTFAERTHRAFDHDVPNDAPRPGSLVFVSPGMPIELQLPMWWRFVHGASWRNPLGPGSSIEDLDDHPVVHVTWEDATAFAQWDGKSLPTEAEWELAARGGLSGAEYAWGDDLMPSGRMMANTWQGEFPWYNRQEDGWDRTSPVTAFPPNAYGLYDMIGNVWEWTADWYGPYYTIDAGRGRPDDDLQFSRGIGNYEAYEVPTHVPRKVMKGGSHLCAPNYCRRYRPAARRPEGIDTSACHVGFRCVERSSAAHPQR